MPIISPLALSWSFVYGTYYSALTLDVVLLRLKSNMSLGFPGSIYVEAPENMKSKAPLEDIEEAKSKLFVRSRIHGNFIEHVPLPYILLTLAELNGAPSKLVNTGFALLFIGRLLHAHGMKRAGSLGITRAIATLITLIVNVSVGSYNVYLARDSLKLLLSL